MHIYHVNITTCTIGGLLLNHGLKILCGLLFRHVWRLSVLLEWTGRRDRAFSFGRTNWWTDRMDRVGLGRNGTELLPGSPWDRNKAVRLGSSIPAFKYLLRREVLEGVGI